MEQKLRLVMKKNTINLLEIPNFNKNNKLIIN